MIDIVLGCAEAFGGHGFMALQSLGMFLQALQGQGFATQKFRGIRLELQAVLKHAQGLGVAPQFLQAKPHIEQHIWRLGAQFERASEVVEAPRKILFLA